MAGVTKLQNTQRFEETSLHGESGEVDKNEPVLLAQLDTLYNVINEYDPEEVYNMDETGLFYRRLLEAANYVQRAWDAVTSTTISNARRKAK